MQELSKLCKTARVDLHIAVNGLTLRMNNVVVEVDVHGPHKSQVFWRLLTSTASFKKIVEGHRKQYVQFGELIDVATPPSITSISSERFEDSRKDTDLNQKRSRRVVAYAPRRDVWRASLESFLSRDRPLPASLNLRNFRA